VVPSCQRALKAAYVIVETSTKRQWYEAVHIAAFQEDNCIVYGVLLPLLPKPSQRLSVLSGRDSNLVDSHSNILYPFANLL
jgi:hypothetical protein